MKIITGGVTAAKGFQAASTVAGIKYQGRLIWQWYIVRNRVWQQVLLRQIL